MNDHEFQADSARDLGDLPPRAHPAADTPIAMLHRHLRGRYALTTILALALAIPAAIGGYIAVKPKYTSTGIVRVKPSLPKNLYEIEENQQMRSFDSFVSAQASTLESARVIEMAVEDPVLHQSGWPAAPEGVALLAKSIDVNLKRGAEIINISVSHPEPTISRHAVDAILHAYDQIQREKFGAPISDKERDLLQRQADADREIQAIRLKIRDVQQLPGTEDRDGIYALKVELQLQLEQEVAEIDARLARLKDSDAAQPAPDKPKLDEAAEREKLIQTLAQSDRILNGLLAEKVTLDTEIQSKLSTYGAKHSLMLDLMEHRRALLGQIDERVNKLVESGAAIAAPSQNPQILTSEQLIARKSQLTPLLNTVRGDVKQIMASRATFNALSEQAGRTERRYNEISHALEVLLVENKNIADGRVQIIQWGNLPAYPSSDRRIPLGAAGGIGGAALGVGLVCLLGFIRGNIRYIDDVERTNEVAALISAIPDLASNDPGERELAALSVHHLRNMLNLRAGRNRGEATVLTVSSSSSGDGKTTITLALGTSFAVGGFKTLLIDADLVGRGLSRQLNLGAMPGLSDAIMNGHLNGEVRPGPQAGVSVLPTGAAVGFDPEMLSSQALNKLLETCRSNYDVVLIDTGPVLGSLEANLAAPLSDGVVLVISRGQNAKLVRSTLRRIEQLGTPCMGLVFNKVKSADFHQSAAGQCLSTRSVSYMSRTTQETTPTASFLATAVGGTRQPSSDENK